MTGHVGASGAWKEMVSGCAVGVSGAWKAIEGMWVGAGGVWKQFYEAFSYPLDGGTVTIDSVVNDGGTAQAGIRLNRDGTYDTDDATGNWTLGSGYWIDPATATIGDDYEARMTADAGTIDSGTTGSWLALSSTRTWQESNTGLVAEIFEGTLEIRRASDGVVVSTTDIAFSCVAVIP